MEKYTDEISIQMLISILKANNIRKVVASPGTTNITFVASIQNDSFFEIHSCVDERSACYLACGLAAESNEPVVLSCTGATASRNYPAGLTEAYYRKLPIIALTSTQYIGKIGNNVPQIIDRTNIMNDIAKISVQVPAVNSPESKWNANLQLNKAILEVKRNGFGPVHINIETNYSKNFDVIQLPKTRIIRRFEYFDELPDIKNNKIAIYVGAHKKWSKELEQQVDKFCENYNGVVICDHTSNYHGKYKIIPSVVVSQKDYNSKLKEIDLLIYIGDISGAYFDIKPNDSWRVNPDGEIRDYFKNLTNVFQMREEDFFKMYNLKAKGNDIIKNDYYNEWINEIAKFKDKLNNIELPFSNPWISSQLINKIPDKSTIHLAILNTLRSWNFFETDKHFDVYCNTGGFGIDGIVSTMVGASLNDKNKNIYGIVGDLAFFYDLNSLCNREIGKNLRIILINNGCGTEFHNYNHMAGSFDYDFAGKFIAADGHNGCKSTELVKHYSTDLGFKYLTASNKTDFNKVINEFVNEDSDKSIIFEIFTNSKDESQAVYDINHLDKSLKSVVKNTIKKTVGPKGIKTIKKIIKK